MSSLNVIQYQMFALQGPLTARNMPDWVQRQNDLLANGVEAKDLSKSWIEQYNSCFNLNLRATKGGGTHPLRIF